MYSTIQILHSYWAYLVILILTLATLNAIFKSIGGKPYGARDFRISLFTLIVSHIQLLIGLLLYFVSPRLALFGEVGMGEIMGDSTNRLYLIEHPIINILAVVFITIGYSKHKRKLTSASKFKTLAIFYSLGLILLLSRIPWDTWLS